ncbi:hypothetical protein PMIN03_009545 [Paraphaeosphaeria minitans]
MTLYVAAATMNSIPVFADWSTQAPTIPGTTSQYPGYTPPDPPRHPSPAHTIPPPPYYAVPQPPSYISQFPETPRPPYEPPHVETPRTLESQSMYERPRRSPRWKFWRHVGIPICWLAIVMMMGGLFASLGLVFLWPKAREEHTGV